MAPALVSGPNGPGGIYLKNVPKRFYRLTNGARLFSFFTFRCCLQKKPFGVLFLTEEGEGKKETFPPPIRGSETRKVSLLDVVAILWTDKHSSSS